MNAARPDTEEASAPQAPRLLHVALLLAACAGMVHHYGLIDNLDSPIEQRSRDYVRYRAMAAAAPRIAVEVESPYSYRILGPYLAGLLPFPDLTSFRVLAIAFSAVLVVGFYLFLCRYGIPGSAAALTVFFLMCNKFFFGFSLWNPFQINDVLTLCLLVLLYWAMLEGRWAVFGLALFLGALTRETAALMIPVAFVRLAESRTLRRDWWKVAVAALPAVAAYIAIRCIVHPLKGTPLSEAFGRYVTKLVSPASLFHLLVSSSWPFVLFPFVFYETSLKFFRGRKYAVVYLVLVFASTLFGAENERLMGPTFIVFYPLLAVMIRDHFQGRRGALALLCACAFASTLSASFGAYKLPHAWLTLALAGSATLIATGAALWCRLSAARAGG